MSWIIRILKAASLTLKTDILEDEAIDNEWNCLSVLHITETIKGGIATYLNNILPLQCRDLGGRRIGVVIPEHHLDQLNVFEGLKVYTFKSTSSRLVNAFRAAILSYRIRNDNAYSVIHTHSSFAGAIARPLMALLLPKATHVYCAHGWSWDRPCSRLKKTFFMQAEKILSLLSDAVVCISMHDYRSAIDAGLSPIKLKLILNGILDRPLIKLPALAKSLWPDNRLKVLFIGRFDQQKGVDVFINALTLTGSQTFGLFVGAAVLKEDANKMHFPNNSLSLGWLSQNEIDSILPQADVLVVPSRWEGFGLVAIEAMRAGVAVIASNVGGLSEIIVDYVTGRLIPPNDPKTLACVLNGHSREEWRNMGEAGHLRFKKFYTAERAHVDLFSVYTIKAQGVTR